MECSWMMRESGVQSQVESHWRLKWWYLIPPCLTLSIMRYVSRLKWSNPQKGVARSSTAWCSSYWKGSQEKLLTATKNNTVNIKINWTTTTRKQTWDFQRNWISSNMSTIHYYIHSILICYEILKSEKQYKHKPEPIRKTKSTILKDFASQTNGKRIDQI